MIPVDSSLVFSILLNSILLGSGGHGRPRRPREATAAPRDPDPSPNSPVLNKYTSLTDKLFREIGRYIYVYLYIYS